MSSANTPLNFREQFLKEAQPWFANKSVTLPNGTVLIRLQDTTPKETLLLLESYATSPEAQITHRQNSFEFILEPIIDDEVFNDALETSIKKYGPIVPCYRGVYNNGQLIEGHHRLAIDPNCKVITLDWVITKKDYLKAKQIFHLRRTVPPEERKSDIIDLAKEGVTPKELVDDYGYYKTDVYKFYPDELKNQAFVQLGKKSAEKRIAAKVDAPVAMAPKESYPLMSSAVMSSIADLRAKKQISSISSEEKVKALEITVVENGEEAEKAEKKKLNQQQQKSFVEQFRGFYPVPLIKAVASTFKGTEPTTEKFQERCLSTIGALYSLAEAQEKLTELFQSVRED